MDEYGLQKMDITREELHQITNAFKKDEFKKLFAEYCEEIRDPENKKRYEEELKQLEAERGIDVTFIHPQPGFVIKTSANGKKKIFINVAKSDKVNRPSSTPGTDSKGGRGLQWSIPYTQAPPRNDLDKKREHCIVYDVVFHPDTLLMAERNPNFRKMVIDTSLDAVKSAFSVDLDLVNLRFPKMFYKGEPRPTIIRKANGKCTVNEPSPIDNIYPPLQDDKKNTEALKPKKSMTPTPPTNQSYTTPKFQITHRSNVEYHEMTHELDSKINSTIPKELIVSIHLPLLNSTEGVQLDVTPKRIYLISEMYARYKLEIDLPYEVLEVSGIARFDKSSKKLIITLPVSHKKQLKIVDITNCRDDSGVDSDHDSPKQKLVTELNEDDLSSANKGYNDDGGKAQNVPDDKSDSDFISPDNSPTTEAAQSTLLPSVPSSSLSTFLDKSIPYILPPFICDLINNTIVVTLQIKNVDQHSIEISDHHHQNSTDINNIVQIKFTSTGSGFFPTFYAFTIQLPNECEHILHADAEAWDNNVIFQIEMECSQLINTYLAGLDINDLKSFEFSKILENLIENDEEVFVDKKTIKESDNIKTNFETINIQSAQSSDNMDSKSNKTMKKNNKKKNRKIRSFSESNCDDIQIDPIGNYQQPRKTSVPSVSLAQMQQHLKTRSLSESSNDDPTMPKVREIKSILKRRSSYNRSISESSVDEHTNGLYHGSIDLSVVGSIPEESNQEMSESVKKTVRFDNRIRKQLYKIRSSIVGQRQPQAIKRKKKKRSQDRHNSEGESSDYDSSSKSSNDITPSSSVESQSKPHTKQMKKKKKNANVADENDPLNAMNATTDLVAKMQINDCSKTKNNSNDLNFKCDMIFDIEM